MLEVALVVRDILRITQLAPRRGYRGIRVLPNQSLFEWWPMDNTMVLAQGASQKTRQEGIDGGMIHTAT